MSIMSKKRLWPGLGILILILAGCQSQVPPTATPEPPTITPPPPTATPAPPTAQEGLWIGEVMPGVAGVANNREFIELYNAGTEAVDLESWSLWYRLADNKEEELVYTWESRADVPANGHYLLVKAGQDVGTLADAEYDAALFEKKGGLALRNPDGQTVDSLVWGEGPGAYQNGDPAPAPEGGASLERLPGASQGNGVNSGNNAVDFVSNPEPVPQNSGDPVTPLPEKWLAIGLDLPSSAEPGSKVTGTVEIQNLTGSAVHDVQVRIPMPERFEVVSAPQGASQSGPWLEWKVSELAAGASETGQIILQSPWTYLSSLVRGYYVEAGDWQGRAYGPLTRLTIEGGSIPVGTARTLTGKTVTVEGVATMYTDGFYAGSTGTKFYLQDETGGIQVYCPGGKDLVAVEVGDRVRVTGEIQVYRDSMELVPATYPDDVKVLSAQEGEPPPAEASLDAASSDERLLGRLVVVEGVASRVEEFSYSYEVDLMDDAGQTLLVYVDKETGVTTEPLDVGKRYRVTGISELYNGQREILPRFQSDLAQVFPPELMIEVSARNSVLPGGTITYTLTAYNHTDAPLTSTHVNAPLPSLVESDAPPKIVTPLQVLDGGDYEDGYAFWNLGTLQSGQSATVRYTIAVDEDAGGQVIAEAATAFADEWLDPAGSEPLRTFIGRGVPIWAIQGPGATSPYVRQQATTEGVVIGAFPGLGGFWIEEPETDDDPATSAGLFVLTQDASETGSTEGVAAVKLGDKVKVSGKVRELSGQTLLAVAAPEDLVVLSSGNALPVPVELDPPLDEEEARDYYEALEGMLVQVSEPAVAVGPTSQYGETPLVRAEWGIGRVMKGDPKGMIIFVDDGSAVTHLDRAALPFALASGDTASEVIGPLAYTYENFKIEPIAVPVVSQAPRPLPALAPAGPDQFSVATFNAENLFDNRDPHPSDPPLPTRSQYQLDLTKTAAAIEAMGAPTIVGLQEVENVDILSALAGQESIAGYGYEPFLVEGTDSRGIDVGYLVRGDQATVEGATAYPAPEGLTSRPPLAITVTVHLAGGDQTVYVLNNHFLSMSGGEKPTEPVRKAQAAWNVTLVDRILAARTDAYVAVLGDLNSFYDSPPLDVLREAGLRHVYEFVAPDMPYSYVYEGESETLDHIVVTPSLYEHLARVEVLHIDADYPPPAPDDPSAYSVSDHDPLVAVFSFP